MKILLENCSEKREEWLRLRKEGIGSSEIAAVCGMSKYRTALEVWAEMTGKIPGFEGNDYTWLGSEMEPVIGKLFERRQGVSLIKPDYLAAHDEHGWAIATPDFLTESEDRKIVETKNAGARQGRFWEDGKAPVHYQIQLQWQLGICGVPEGYLAGLIGGSPDDFYAVPYEFDKELFNVLLEEGEIFMELVRRDVPPLAGVGDSKLIAQLQGTRVEQIEMLFTDVEPFVDMWQDLAAKVSDLNKQLKLLNDERDKIKGRILQAIGNKTMGQLPDGRLISAKTITKNQFVTPAHSYVDFRIKNAPKEKGK